MKALFKKTIIIASILILTSAVWIWHAMHDLANSPMQVPESGFVLEVEPGGHLNRVFSKLKQHDIIKNSFYLKLYARWYGLGQKIHVGEYQLQQGMTPQELLTNLSEGKVIQYSITIVEGWTFKQMIEHIRANPNLNHTIDAQTSEGIMAAIGLTGQHPEGRFMPDTYYFPRGMTDSEFLLRAYRAMQTYLENAWPNRDVGIPIKTPYEAMILASIVEKETGLASERKMIAGVFSRRLVKRMRLQSDPTVIYGMGDRYDGNIRRKDLNTDTPYNTYQRFGLPPTPIALPGRDAIDAVLHPLDGEALYFVSKGDGSHYFSATLQEHNEAVIKYQLKGRKKPFSSYKPE